MNKNVAAVIALADGVKTSIEIGALVGLSPRYVRRILQRLDLPRLRDGARRGVNNSQYFEGRRITHDGYALITPPEGHPTARVRKGKIAETMYEHRFVLEQKLGRLLLPEEICDHIDGLTLHNAPSNLRVFSSNAAHLHATLSGKVPQWSDAGLVNMQLKYQLRKISKRVDIYHQRKASGDVRLHQILLLALSLGTDSPYLLGTSRHTKKAGIDMSSRSTIEHALADLLQRWEVGHTR